MAELNLATALGDHGLCAESEAAAQRAFAKGLDTPEIWLILARALVALGRYDDAEAAFQQALTRRPIYTAAHSELAQLIWMRSGDIGKACTAVDAVIAARPNDTDFRLIKAKLLEYGDPDAAYGVRAEAMTKGAADTRIDIVAAQAALGRRSRGGPGSCRAGVRPSAERCAGADDDLPSESGSRSGRGRFRR